MNQMKEGVATYGKLIEKVRNATDDNTRNQALAELDAHQQRMADVANQTRQEEPAGAARQQPGQGAVRGGSKPGQQN